VKAVSAGMVALVLLGFGGACGDRASQTPPVDGQEVTQAAEEDATHQDEAHAEGTGESEDRLTLSDTAMRTAGIKTDTVALGADLGGGLVVPGQVQFDPRRVALISPRAGGRIERLAVVEGDRVWAGQTVAHLYSAAFATAQADLIQAGRRATLLKGTTDSAGAFALAGAARRRLRLLGVTDSQLDHLADHGQPADFLPLTSPLDGTITESHTLPGAAVDAGAPVFEVSDLSVMDVVAEVPEPSLPLVRIGQAAAVSIAAYPGMTFEGEVERMSGELNPETRTVQAVVHVPNRGHRLRSGMFATVRLAIASPGPPSASALMLSVPAGALVTEGERHFAFVEVDPNTFERREVEVASLTPAGSLYPVQGRVAVRSGLRAGERVVVEGTFTLKSELAKASLGGHGH
jgi:RND family efflux transporter MFP subunit